MAIEATRLEWVSPHGDRIALINPEGDYEVACVAEDGIEGLVGSFDDESSEVPGVPGARFRLRDRRVQPLTGALECVLMDSSQWRRFRQAWSTRLTGTLRLTVDGLVWSLPCRLSEPVESPGRMPRAGTIIPVNLISDGGVWTTFREETGTVQVTNFGDVDLPVSVRWSGAGGNVVLPSGAVMRLPKVKAEHVVSLDPRSGMTAAVLAGDGSVEPSAAAMRVLGEVVPVGEVGVFTVPAGARLEWKVGVFDPWM